MQTDGRTDSQTDLTKLIVAFGNFANAPKKNNFVTILHKKGNGKT
jgi:hypothetical protein